MDPHVGGIGRVKFLAKDITTVLSGLIGMFGFNVVVEHFTNFHRPSLGIDKGCTKERYYNDEQDSLHKHRIKICMKGYAAKAN